MEIRDPSTSPATFVKLDLLYKNPVSGPEFHYLLLRKATFSLTYLERSTNTRCMHRQTVRMEIPRVSSTCMMTLWKLPVAKISCTERLRNACSLEGQFHRYTTASLFSLYLSNTLSSDRVSRGVAPFS